MNYDPLGDTIQQRDRARMSALVLGFLACVLGVSLGVSIIKRATEKELQLRAASALVPGAMTTQELRTLLAVLDEKGNADPVAITTRHLIREARRLAGGCL